LNLEVLDRSECLRLLGSQSLGRIAVVVSGQPLIFPVYYTVDGNAVVFRTDPGVKIRGAVGSRVAFETDAPGTEDAAGWSVLVVGTAELVDSTREATRLSELASRAWNPGPKEHWVRIRIGAISGRRISG
jgi:nitroimidazol reductase NimA-like FMN-containing flavoprotein (pyridoxamine 5'-phosphate oxidase superfamily)